MALRFSTSTSALTLLSVPWPQMENDTVILVGNGPSLLDHPNGLQIDSFDYVVRFNNFNITKHPEFSGTKVDIWFLVSNVAIRRYQCKEVYFHTWEREKRGHKHFQKIQEVYPDAKCVEEIWLAEMFDEFKSDEPYHMPSTGLIAIYLMLRRFSEVSLTGFDWWEMGRYNSNHYFDRASPRFMEDSRGHKPLIEKYYIDKWSDRIRFLR